MWTKLPGQAAGSPFPLLAAIARPLRRGGLPLAFGSEKSPPLAVPFAAWRRAPRFHAPLTGESKNGDPICGVLRQRRKVSLASSWLSCAMGVSLSVCCCPPRQRIDDDGAGNEVHVVHELDHDSLDDLPAVMSVMPPGHFFIPLIAPTQGAHTFPRCCVRSPVDCCRIGLWTF